MSKPRWFGQGYGDVAGGGSTPTGGAPAAPAYGSDPFGIGAKELTLDQPRTFHIPQWDWMDDRKRIATLRRIAESSGRDPRIRHLATQIVQQAGADPRNYPGQAAALLAFVQNRLYYVNEPGEILQDPLYTLKVGHGDCDDLALILAALCESIRLPWRFVLSGVDKKTRQKARWIEGEPYPQSGEWTHIYVCIGWPPFKPTTWAIAEPTVRGAQLGHDVAIQGSVMPEMRGGQMAGLGRTAAGKPVFGVAPPLGVSLSIMPTTEAASRGVTAAILADLDWKHITSATIVGVATSVLGQLVIDAVRAWQKLR